MRASLFILVAVCLNLAACSQTPDPKVDVKGEPAYNGDPIGPAEFRSAIDRGDALLVDVRTPQEYQSGHIPGSLNLDWTAPDYEQKFATLDPERPVLLYCASGGRSDQAGEYLQGKGYQVLELEEGIASWKKAGLPLERE